MTDDIKTKPNPLAPATEEQVEYSKLPDGRWLGVISRHESMQTHFVGATKEECQSKVKEYFSIN